MRINSIRLWAIENDTVAQVERDLCPIGQLQLEDGSDERLDRLAFDLTDRRQSGVGSLSNAKDPRSPLKVNHSDVGESTDRELPLYSMSITCSALKNSFGASAKATVVSLRVPRKEGNSALPHPI